MYIIRSTIYLVLICIVTTVATKHVAISVLIVIIHCKLISEYFFFLFYLITTTMRMHLHMNSQTFIHELHKHLQFIKYFKLKT